MKIKFLVLLFAVFSIIAFADRYDTDAAKARTMSGANIIKCSPKGGGDTLSVAEALRVLKSGDVLQLYPGTYETPMVISTDKVIIEGGIPDQFCDLKIEISGKNCIVRKLWANQIEMSSGVFIIDTILNYLNSSYNQKKFESVLYNSCCRAVYLGEERHNLAIIYSTIIQSCPTCFALAGSGSVSYSIRDSIIYAKYIVFRITRTPKIDIQNSVVFGENGLAKCDSMDKKNRGQIAIDISSFKKMNRGQAKNVMNEKPLFKRETKMGGNDSRLGFCDSTSKIWFWETGTQESPDFFCLESNSPIIQKKIGANLNENGFPVPR